MARIAHPCLVPNLRGKLSAFIIIEYNVSCGFVLYDLRVQPHVICEVVLLLESFKRTKSHFLVRVFVSVI